MATIYWRNDFLGCHFSGKLNMGLIAVKKLNKVFPMREMVESKLAKEVEMGGIILEYLEVIQNLG